MVGLLTNDKGERRSWSEFKKLAAPVTALYNKTWLETEYNQAMANATMGSKWNGFADNADLYPNLEYRAVMDGRTRDEHAALHGTVLPIDDPFWETNYPPNGWGCRCSVTQTDKPEFQSDASKKVTPDPGFDFNPGIDKKLFSDTSGYYRGVEKSTSEQVNSIAERITIRTIEKEAVEALRGETINVSNLNIAFNRTGIEKTYNMNSSNPATALAAIQNIGKLGEMMKGAHHTTEPYMKVDGSKMLSNLGILKYHVWEGSGYTIKARETSEGKLLFYYLKLF